MAAMFLATLYEYSPLFYIAVVFVCFVVTSGLVLGWFGVDVPIILRNSEEPDSISSISTKPMMQVKNPFGLEIADPGAASLSGGVALRLDCLEDCRLSVFWGCRVQRVHEALQKHVYCAPIRTPTAMEEALSGEYLHREQHPIPRQSGGVLCLHLPQDHSVQDFGPVPRSRYPLVALLTLCREEDRELHLISSMLTVIHIPDRSYRLPCRIVHQYLLTAHGHFYDLKQLFMSANSSPDAPPADPPSSDVERVVEEPVDLWEEPQEDGAKDCVVCQNDAVNWVLLPCRHACLCDGCLRHFQHCPMCRQFVQETFPLQSPEGAHRISAD
uniref:Cell growth regulator with RING finger domain protein 1 n=1 Tax=Leptobrachium leishanense TaxID=445787 RepID=A0A8C5QMH7_9ANUR